MSSVRLAPIAVAAMLAACGGNDDNGSPAEPRNEAEAFAACVEQRLDNFVPIHDAAQVPESLKPRAAALRRAESVALYRPFDPTFGEEIEVDGESAIVSPTPTAFLSFRAVDAAERHEQEGDIRSGNLLVILAGELIPTDQQEALEECLGRRQAQGG